MAALLPVLIRPCFEHDLPFVQLIYAHHVITGTGSFEIDPPDLAAMKGRWAAIAARGWPYLVACDRGDPSRVHGFAYAAQFRDRSAYAATFEDSLYVAPHALGRGVGSHLLAALLHEIHTIGGREVLALVGDRENKGSIRVHERAGFHHCGLLRDVGQKFGRSLDVVLLQRSLPAGADMALNLR